uniref:Uncharacterized protein n=1 Tax=Anguilla anguilla TaxID=7936 RepID=A0A0E9PQ17_ANGAN
MLNYTNDGIAHVSCYLRVVCFPVLDHLVFHKSKKLLIQFLEVLVDGSHWVRERLKPWHDIHQAASTYRLSKFIHSAQKCFEL